ncbi:MAG: DUF4178 domain-containing protein [Candidatus Accumulibacter sp.]|nr:DUF4178 domain-containing protein [Accumulibacter sp.]
MSAASVYVVCNFCRSTLLRVDEDLKNLGRMAELMDDPSPIQLATWGKFEKTRFSVIGRIQMKYESGFWNEWRLLCDDGSCAWLSDSAGEYIFSRQVTVDEEIPPVETLRPGAYIFLNGIKFQATDIESARCIAGQGELPFEAKSGYAVKTVDLRNEEGLFATLDYSETPPLVFLGKPARFGDLYLKNLRPDVPQEAQDSASRIQVEVFNCPHCAAPLKIHSLKIKSVACGSCRSIIDAESRQIERIQVAALNLRVTPRLPLGQQGKWKGIGWEIIGFMRRRARYAGIFYYWHEYLLFSGKEGFAWLTEFRGHWNFVRTLSTPPRASHKMIFHDKKAFQLFNEECAETDYVVGEFYWEARVGDFCQITDYVSPPQILSRETSDNEIVWSMGEYLEPADLYRAFGMENPPERVGIYANQINPWKERLRWAFLHFLGFLLAGSLIHSVFLFFAPARKVFQQEVSFQLTSEPTANPNANFSTRGSSSLFRKTGQAMTEEFVLEKFSPSLHLKHHIDLKGKIEVATTLINANTGKTHRAIQELGFYWEADEEDTWFENKPSDATRFQNISAGRYYMILDYDAMAEFSMSSASDRIELERRSVNWPNYFILVVFLSLFPIFSLIGYFAFESRRWEESSFNENDED